MSVHDRTHLRSAFKHGDPLFHAIVESNMFPHPSENHGSVIVLREQKGAPVLDELTKEQYAERVASSIVCRIK